MDKFKIPLIGREIPIPTLRSHHGSVSSTDANEYEADIVTERRGPPPPPRSNPIGRTTAAPNPYAHMKAATITNPYNSDQPAKPNRSPLALVVGNSPNNSYALANVAAINPADYPAGVNVVVDNMYVFTTMHHEDAAPGSIGLNGNQRTWGGWSLGEKVKVQYYDMIEIHGKLSYLADVVVEISFRSRAKAVSTPFSSEELSAHFRKRFENQILSATQYLIFEFKGIIFDLRIRTVTDVDISEVNVSNVQPSNNLQSKGILLAKSNVTFVKGKDGLVNIIGHEHKNTTRSTPVIRPDFKFEDLGVGGLNKEFTKIFRRAFASRIFPPAVIEKLGISHVKGLLLYGPPGTGKTLIARKIGTMLDAQEPKIVNGPEILSKFVGSSEENIRSLFKEAEEEYRARGDESSLHIIIFDELDSVFKQRGSRGDGTGVGDNVVNQLLAKMDGVDQLNNILVIGMTNRKDLIDTALLRPGRFEVQVEIHLPDEEGRLQILEIQTKKMRENNMLEKGIDLSELAALTKNFSGAEIEGLVKSASSFAINKSVNINTVSKTPTSKDMANFKVTKHDFMNALTEIQPAFGVNEEDLKTCVEGGIILYSEKVTEILKQGERYSRQVKESTKSRLLSLLVHGPANSGKTALAAAIALKSQFPFIRMISPNDIAGMSESAKISHIDNCFRDAYRSPLNILVIDSFETLVDWVPIGPRFSNNILQVLKVALKRKPPQDRRLLIITTTSNYHVLKQMDILSCFDSELSAPLIKNLDEFNNVLIDTDFLNDPERVFVINELARHGVIEFDVGIKRLLTNIETARHDEDPVNEIIRLMQQAT